MKRAFITVRFNRMKNHDSAIQCKDINYALKDVDTKQLQFNVSLERFEKMKTQLRSNSITNFVIKFQELINLLDRYFIPKNHANYLSFTFFIRKIAYCSQVFQRVLSRKGYMDKVSGFNEQSSSLAQCSQCGSSAKFPNFVGLEGSHQTSIFKQDMKSLSFSFSIEIGKRWLLHN